MEAVTRAGLGEKALGLPQARGLSRLSACSVTSLRAGVGPCPPPGRFLGTWSSQGQSEPAGPQQGHSRHGWVVFPAPGTQHPAPALGPWGPWGVRTTGAWPPAREPSSVNPGVGAGGDAHFRGVRKVCPLGLPGGLLLKGAGGHLLLEGVAGTRPSVLWVTGGCSRPAEIPDCGPWPGGACRTCGPWLAPGQPAPGRSASSPLCLSLANKQIRLLFLCGAWAKHLCGLTTLGRFFIQAERLGSVRETLQPRSFSQCRGTLPVVLGPRPGRQQGWAHALPAELSLQAHTALKANQLQEGCLLIPEAPR